MEELRYIQRFRNFEKVYFKIKEIAELKNKNEYENMALIQAFEYNYELAWNLLKDYLYELGFVEQSPRMAIKRGFEQGICSEKWLDSIKMRNITSHTYSEVKFNQTVNYIENEFIFLLDELYNKFKVDIINV